MLFLVLDADKLSVKKDSRMVAPNFPKHFRSVEDLKPPMIAVVDRRDPESPFKIVLRAGYPVHVSEKSDDLFPLGHFASLATLSP
jgi:hypothetical protein